MSDKRSITSKENGKLGGRPKGSTTKPQLKDYLTPEDVEKLISVAKEKSEKGDTTMMKFILDHIFGKAIQPSEISGNVEVTGVNINVRK